MRYLHVRKEVLRESLGQSQRVVSHSVRSFAKQVRTSHGTIGHLLTGEMPSVNEELALRIAGALGKDVEDLFFLAESSTSCDIDSPSEGASTE